jgi:hypothetical protein
MPLPELSANVSYRLEVMNGPRLAYSCNNVSAVFVLGRLRDFLDHAPLHAFRDCLNCQAGLQLAQLIRQSEPDPVIEQLERLNEGLLRGWVTAEGLPVCEQEVYRRMIEDRDKESITPLTNEQFRSIADKMGSPFTSLGPVILLPKLPEPAQPSPTPDIAKDQAAALTRDELRKKDDKVQETVDGWDDYECSGAWLLIDARGITRQRAQDIRRKEEAKVK